MQRLVVVIYIMVSRWYSLVLEELCWCLRMQRNAGRSDCAVGGFRLPFVVTMLTVLTVVLVFLNMYQSVVGI